MTNELELKNKGEDSFLNIKQWEDHLISYVEYKEQNEGTNKTETNSQTRRLFRICYGLRRQQYRASIHRNYADFLECFCFSTRLAECFH